MSRLILRRPTWLRRPAWLPAWIRVLRLRLKARHLLIAWVLIFTGIVFWSLHEQRQLSSENSHLIEQNRTIALQARNVAQQTTEIAKRTRTIALEGRRAHIALCAFRDNLERGVANARRYLADVQAGRRERVPGITDADIRASIARQQTTIDSLSEAKLDCAAEGPKGDRP